VNRLCSQIAFRFGWGFVNVNLRPFYAEGSKSMGFEIAEALGWRAPDHVVAPMAGGSLIGKIHKAFREFEHLGLLDGPVSTRMYGAQAAGCNPISATVKTGANKVKPIRNPVTVAKSLAIGDPADGYFASQLIRETGGWSEDVDDDDIIDAMTLLAETEGIWAETAGGVTLAVARKLIDQGKIDRDGSTVLCITGNGLKTQEALGDRLAKPVVIEPTLEAFEALVEAEGTATAPAHTSGRSPVLAEIGA
jgi:threonine synthase